MAKVQSLFPNIDLDLLDADEEDGGVGANAISKEEIQAKEEARLGCIEDVSVEGAIAPSLHPRLFCQSLKPQLWNQELLPVPRTLLFIL